MEPFWVKLEDQARGFLAPQLCASSFRLAGQGRLVRTRAVQWLIDRHACLALHDLDQRRDQVARQWEDDGRILLDGKLGQRLQVAQLPRRGLRANHGSGPSELSRWQ